MYYRYPFVMKKVFNWSEFPLSEVTSYKIHILVNTIFWDRSLISNFKMTAMNYLRWDFILQTAFLNFDWNDFDTVKNFWLDLKRLLKFSRKINNIQKKFLPFRFDGSRIWHHCISYSLENWILCRHLLTFYNFYRGIFQTKIVNFEQIFIHSSGTRLSWGCRAAALLRLVRKEGEGEKDQAKQASLNLHKACLLCLGKGAQ